MSPPIRVVRVITGLGQGGAEESLRKLVEMTRHVTGETLIISLGRDGVLRPELERAGAEVVEMGMTRVPSPTKLLAMLRTIRAWRPDIIEGWMVHGNVLACAMRWGYPSARLVWNFRSGLQLAAERTLTRYLLYVARALSSQADAIVYNSRNGALEHGRFGYAEDRARYIPNGFDTDRFSFGPGAREAARARWGLPEHAKIVGHVSRWHRHKDHATLLSAFASVRSVHHDAVLVMAGTGLSSDNSALVEQLATRRLRDAVVLLGRVRPTSALYPAFDVFALTSMREGFPNVLGEAMACGVPCVATDVGACRDIIGDPAFIAAVGDADAIARAVVQLLPLGADARTRLGARLRGRIVAEFGVEVFARRYLELYDTLLARPVRSSAAGAAAHPA